MAIDEITTNRVDNEGKRIQNMLEQWSKLFFGIQIPHCDSYRVESVFPEYIIHHSCSNGKHSVTRTCTYRLRRSEMGETTPDTSSYSNKEI